MVHSLRKYLSNRGSALFMVISTMTALMITCMAMYFAVVSSRTAQIAVFNQQQSFQSARSISDILLGGLQGGTLKSGDSALMEKMIKMPVGDSFSTDGNGFASLNPDSGSAEDDGYLGAYDVKITRLNDEIAEGDTYQVYDMAVTSSVNGVRETIHSIIRVRPAQNAPMPSGASQVFAATGYVDQDVYVDGGDFFTDMFMDTEFTALAPYPNVMKMYFNRDLYCGGSLEVRADVKAKNVNDPPVTWCIRNTITTTSNATITFPKGSTLIVGGNLDLGDNDSSIKNADIFVGGDLILGKANYKDCRVFVRGKVYRRNSNYNLDQFGSLYCDGGVFDLPGVNEHGSYNGTWTDNKNLPSGVFKDGDEAIEFLDKKTATAVYYKWEINDRYEKIRTKNENGDWVTTSKDDPTYVKEIDEIHNKAVYKSLYWDVTESNTMPTQTLTYGVDGKGCIIEDTSWNVVNSNANKYNMMLIIDTGDDPDNVYTIRVKANKDADGDGKKETFCWHPDPNILNAGQGFQSNLLILYKGRGSVVVDIPPGVTYQDTTRLITCHYNWYVLAGGTFPFKDESNPVYKEGIQATLGQNFVHHECDGTTCGCSYTTKTSSETCTVCGASKKEKTCAIHEHTFLYCPECEVEPNCKNRVGRKEINDYLAAHPDVEAKMEHDDNNKLIYPTTNFFLVSVDESADVRASITINNQIVGENTFFGFIYAPYMTFKGYGGNQGRGSSEVRFFGGATVSDYVFEDSMALVTCWPERLPQDLMSESCRSETLSGAAKDWKIDLMYH